MASLNVSQSSALAHAAVASHGNPYRDARSGAALTVGEVGLMVFPRHNKAPLRFKGRRLAYHWTRLSRDAVICVEIWQKVKKGFVLFYSYLDDGEIGNRAIEVSNLDEATDCLENICKNLEPPLAKGEFDGMLRTDVHLHRSFRRAFPILTADVLADWHTIPQLQEKC